MTTTKKWDEFGARHKQERAENQRAIDAAMAEGLTHWQAVDRLTRARRATEFAETKRIIEAAIEEVVDQRALNLAEQIIRCGKLARGEIPTPPLSTPPPGSTAARIIEINRGRGKLVEPRFSDDEAGRRAKMIVNSARKRDGKEPLK